MPLLISSVANGQHDSSEASHITIVKDANRSDFAQVKDEDFCNKLKAISIPDSTKFTDDGGNEITYFLNIEMQFNRRKKIIGLRPNINSVDLKDLILDVCSILKAANWTLPKHNKNKKFLFESTITRNGLRNISILDDRESQGVNMCD